VLSGALTFREIDVPLAGFEEWLRLAAIKVTSSKRMVTVKYKRPKDAIYPSADGKLSIQFESAGDSSGAVFGTALSLKETASAALHFKKPLALNDIIAQCLSKVVLFGERSLRRALGEYVEHYHAERNHQGRGNVLLFPRDTNIRRGGPVQCRERLGPGDVCIRLPC
jgi:ApeA N-terminal domain 1